MGGIKEARGRGLREPARGLLAESTEIKLWRKGQNFQTQQWDSGILRVSKAKGRESVGGRGSWGGRGVRVGGLVLPFA